MLHIFRKAFKSKKARHRPLDLLAAGYPAAGRWF
jgi:hypothetical protein